MFCCNVYVLYKLNINITDIIFVCVADKTQVFVCKVMLNLNLCFHLKKASLSSTAAVR